MPAELSRSVASMGSSPEVELRDGLTFGRGREADVRIADPAVSRQHCQIESVPGGWRVRDLGSRTGTLVNGRLFEVHDLIYGDSLQLGEYAWRFDGCVLAPMAVTGGVRLVARDVIKRAGKREILRGISVRIEPGKFVGILGTSGAGKSTLLDGLSGIRPVTAGSIEIDGEELRSFLRLGAAGCGYVPQDDIVHGELTVSEAVRFSARLRLPGDVPEFEIEKLVRQTIERLGLAERAEVRVHRLSGGQRKRVSIATEVLARPAILFLDEPSSGLDPATEFKLMELLRELANLGCTVICTTHVMENVYLFDQLIVVVAGRLIFSGGPSGAREHFQIDRFAELYDRIEEQQPEHWAQKFAAPSLESAPAKGPSPLQLRASARKRPGFFGIMLSRQWKILRAEPKNFVILLGQPVLVGLLVAWIAPYVSFKLFLAYLATFWFGCSNAGQQIVKESGIYRRERIIGLGRHAYLLSKFVFWGAITAMQALVFFGCIHIGKVEVSGPAWLQLGAVVATAICAVGIGTAVSALVRTTTQAVMVVPLILLPQIVLSGFVVPPFEPSAFKKRGEPDRQTDRPFYEFVSGGGPAKWQRRGGEKRPAFDFVPSYSVQTVMDASLFQGQPVPEMPASPTGGLAFPRLKAAADQGRLSNATEKTVLKPGGTFDEAGRVGVAFCRLAAWTGLSYLIAIFALVIKERAS